MTHDAFSELAYQLWECVPADFKEKIRNVALLIEDEPDADIRMEEGLGNEDTLLGLYRGIPYTLRGEGYGVGMTLPDTITLYRLPIIAAAREDLLLAGVDTTEAPLLEAIRRVTAETLWHEVGHYFGLSEAEIHEREEEGTNAFSG